jgi:hypothetical protein
MLSPSRDRAIQLRVALKDRAHFPLETAAKTVPFTAERRTFGADVIIDTVGKGEEKLFGRESHVSKATAILFITLVITVIVVA